MGLFSQWLYLAQEEKVAARPLVSLGYKVTLEVENPGLESYGEDLLHKVLL